MIHKIKIADAKTGLLSNSIDIKQSDVLGSGGEATVVSLNNMAVKIYHQPDITRTQKLQQFIKMQLPNNVCAPLQIVYDSKGKDVVGFTMTKLSKRKEIVQKLSSKKFRRSNPQISLSFISQLFMNAYSTIEQLHPKIIVGDLNDMNVMFDLGKPDIVFIDVDSFQIYPLPCMVGTETYLDPNLYNLDLTKKPYFKPENDWYSFWAMFIKSLIMVHPYGGVHPDYKSLPQRALNRVTFFDDDVKTPKAALSLDLLNDDLKVVIERIFGKGERYQPPVDIIDEYQKSLVTCNSCKVMHPDSLQHCPQCSTINTQQINRRVNVVKSPGKGTVTSEILLETKGSFVWFKQYGKAIYAIERDNSAYSLLRYYKGKKTKDHLFTENKTIPKFDMFADKYLVVNRDNLSDQIVIYDGSNKIAERICDTFYGRAMFKCTKDHLIRLQNGVIYKGWFDNTIKRYVEKQIGNCMTNQTWINASPDGSNVVGMQRYFNENRFFVMTFDKITNRHDIKMPKLDDNESILDISVKFSSGYALILLKTEIQGKTYTRVSVVDMNGNIKSSYRVEALSSDTHRHIHGKMFAKPSGMNGIILHATDDGIVQEVIGNNRIEQQTLLSETEQFIAESDSLFAFKNGILVVSDNMVNYLEMS